MTTIEVRRLSLRSADVDEVRGFGGTHFYPRRFLHPLQRSGRLAARFDLLRLGPLTIGEVSYGADVTLGYEHPDAYQLGVPLAGNLRARQGGREIVGTEGRAPVFRVGEDVVLDYWGADCRQLAVKIGRDVLERQLQTLLDAPIAGPVALPAGLDVSDGPGRTWAGLIRWTAGEYANDMSLLDQPLIASHLIDSLTIGLLLAVEHPYRDALRRPAHAYRPQPVRRAVDAMQAHPEHPFTLAELAGIAGVGARALQDGFKRYVGSSPMAYLRHVRLARVHDDLRAADPRHTTVAETAHRWGFFHLGRFAAAYRARYKIAPSDTLRTGP